MKQYPVYKDSGIKWIGMIPIDWGIKKLKYVSKIITGNTPSKADESNYSEDGFIWVKPDELNELMPIENSKEKLSEEGKKLARIVPKYSVLVCGIGNIGKFGYAGVELSTNQQINSIIWNNNFHHKYGLYLISSMKEEFQRNSERVVVSILNKTRQENIKIVFTSFETQTAIASFLDHKTQQIDDLIAKKQQLIELLKEERTAVINQAVTKGLDPTVPMRNSGIEWLGEIPEHWELLPLKRGMEFLTDFEANGSFSSLSSSVIEDNDNYAVWYVRATDLENSNIDDINKCRYITNDSYEFLSKTKLFGDELLVTKRGEIGKVYLMPRVYRKATLAPNLYLIQLNKKLLPKYAYYYLTSKAGNINLILADKSTTLGALYKDDCKEIQTLFPPTSEQLLIVNFLDNRTKHIDNQILLIEREIELVKEYKTSLINEAVTGKIDVT